MNGFIVGLQDCSTGLVASLLIVLANNHTPVYLLWSIHTISMSMNAAPAPP